MPSLRFPVLSAVLALVFASLSFAAKPVLLIETDLGGDKDDQASFIRLLLHSNELDIQAIICDRPSDQLLTGADVNAWNPSPSTISSGVQMAHHYLDAYDQVHENLRLHDSDYPTANLLKSRVYSGLAGSNAGRDRIIAVVDATPAGSHVYYSNWGSNVLENASSSTTIESSLERAFDKVLADRGDSGLRAFVRKIRQVSLDGNSNRHGTINIRSNYKDIIRDESFHVETGWPVVSNARWYHRFQPITANAGGFQMTNDINDSHGPLAPLYRGAGQKEGDSWSTLYVLPFGLADLAEPTWGGLAGRYLPRTSGPADAQGVPFYWNEASDTWNGSTSRDNTAARFAAVVQNAFRARWDWCYMTFAQANHDPVPTVTVNGGNAVTMGVRRLSLAAGSTVNLAASVSDPDSGDSHAYAWTYYPEAGTYTGSLSISGADSANASFTIPSNAAGKQLHVYLAATDDGSRKGNRVPNLTRFCRVVIDVTSGTVAAAIPDAPTNLSAAATSPTVVTLTYTDASANEEGFDLDYKLASAFTWTSALTQTGSTGSGTIRTALFPDLTPGSAYSFRVRAYNDSGESAWVTTDASTEAGAPVGSDFVQADGLLSIEAENATAIIDGTGAAIDPNWVAVTASDASGGSAMGTANTPNDFTTHTTADASALKFNATFTSTGPHYLWVRARGLVAKNGDDSVNYSLDGGTLVRLNTANSTAWTWTRASAALGIDSAGLHTLRIHVRENGTEIDKIVLTPDSAFTPDGNGPAETRGTPAIAPAAPTAVSAAATSPTAVTVSYTDASADETGFDIEYKLTSAFMWTSADDGTATPGTGSAKTATLTNLTANSAYDFRVRSYHATLQSDWVTANATTPAAPAAGGTPLVFEAESLSHTQSDTVTSYNEIYASAGTYDFLASNAVGDYIEYTVDVPAAGHYTIIVRYKAMAKRGIVQLKIDSVPQSEPFDQISNGFQTANLGSKQLTAGNHTFRFEVTGTNGAEYTLTVDSITLTP